MIRSARLWVVASLLGGVWLHTQAQTQPQVASGLIIQLKPTPAEGGLATPTQVQARFQRLGRLAQASGYTSQMPWRHLSEHMVSMRVPTRLSPAMQQKLIDRLMASGQVAWVEPNVKQQLAQSVSSPNDGFYVGALSDPDDLEPEPFRWQWWLKDPAVTKRAGVPGFESAWLRSTGTEPLSPRVVVAVLDTGYLPHADLPSGAGSADPRVLPGRDFVSDVDLSGDGNGWDDDPTDAGDFVTAIEAATTRFKELNCVAQRSTWHGQVISGILGASTNNNLGVAGINWGVRLLPVRVAGKCGADLDDIVAGMYWAAGLTIPLGLSGQSVPSNPNPAKIINISFGGSGSCGNLYTTAIAALKASGVVVVAAAGNEHGAVSRPGNCADVLTVAALNRAGFKSSYSNFGPEVFISTVGGDPGPFSGFSDGGSWGSVLGDTGLLTVSNRGETTAADSDNDYASHAGTSYSAPILAGVVSLMLDVKPDLTIDEIKQGLRASARPHVVSSLMGVCSSQNPGRCICTTSTCGVGILDAAEALAFAANPLAYQPPVRPSAITVDSEPIQRALAAASQDRPPNAPPVVAKSGSGGGGALDLTELLGLTGLLMAGLTLRRP
ncbi:MAG TPA: S8 family serine peptidase [Aquabacterium sp.]|nr:S8 family serine peptidase [Aquabacterium sp.]